MKETSKKVISFSLYGRDPDYTLGAVDNVRHARWFYPDWVCRFYVADDVPRSIVSRLRDYGAEIINMGQYIGHEAMFWRFFVVVDPEVDISIIRDTDSRFSKYELKMVNDWLASSKKFHVIYPRQKKYPVMGGMWGVRGTIPEIKAPLENFIQSPDSFAKETDQKFLLDNLYPLTKGDVYVHEAISLFYTGPRYFYEGEQIQPFNSFLGKRWHIRTGRPRRIFIALSIYKNIPFYEYFLTWLIGIIENRNLFSLISNRTLKAFQLRVKFYVADDIRPDLVERLRRLGQVILKPAETVHKDDPQYWKLSILSDKNLGLALIIGFWEFFFLACIARHGFNLRPFLNSKQLPGSRILFRKLTPLSVCGPDVPLARIDDLVARRIPGTSYQEFIRSTLYPQIATATLKVRLTVNPVRVGVLKGWCAVLLPSRLYNSIDGSGIEKSLKRLLRR